MTRRSRYYSAVLVKFKKFTILQTEELIPIIVSIYWGLARQSFREQREQVFYWREWKTCQSDLPESLDKDAKKRGYFIVLYFNNRENYSERLFPFVKCWQQGGQYNQNTAGKSTVTASSSQSCPCGLSHWGRDGLDYLLRCSSKLSLYKLKTLSTTTRLITS